jgi:hypothetical protein
MQARCDWHERPAQSIYNRKIVHMHDISVALSIAAAALPVTIASQPTRSCRKCFFLALRGEESIATAA